MSRELVAPSAQQRHSVVRQRDMIRATNLLNTTGMPANYTVTLD
jgi:hypothetical protein